MLVKDGSTVAFLGKDSKLEGMPDKTFTKKNEMALTSLLLALEDTILFNIEVESIVKTLWDKLKNIYEGKSLTNKIFSQQ